MSDDTEAQPEQHICLDCAWHSKDGPHMSREHPEYCVHLTPECWAAEGWERNWGDAAVMAWPKLEILRRQQGTKVEYLILNGDMRRPVKLEFNVHISSWGAF